MKAAALILILVTTAFSFIMTLLDIKSAKRGIPANVSDIFDEKEYKRWSEYNREKNILDIVKTLVDAALAAALIGFDFFAAAVKLFNTENIYATCFIVLGADLIISTVVQTAFEAYDTFVIEEKYGFNRTKAGTFIGDTIKNLIISAVLEFGLIALFILIHRAMGWLILPVFTAIVMAFLVAVMFLSPYIMKIFNKSTPLEDGSLRQKLTKLLEDNGCTVREIGVIDASKRSSKANAYFAGFGKTKSIGLYDTLINEMTEDEIVAVFAHEMGHNKHRDTIKSSIFNIINVAAVMIIAFLLVSFPEIYSAFGFTGLNYGFAFVLLGDCCLPFISPLLGLLSQGFSRRNEYAADRFGAENGYAKELISALKKLGKANYANLNPDPIVVKLTYSHPTLSQRIEKLEEYNKRAD